MDGCMLPLSYQYSKYLYYSSFLLGASACISFYFQDYYTFLFMFVLFLSSIQFWRKPDYGIQRDVDMFLCKCLAVYFYMNTLCYYDEFCRTMYMSCFICIFLFLMTEWILYSIKNKQWIIFHMAIHIYVSFFTPFILYIL
jgi:hypothetical protein